VIRERCDMDIIVKVTTAEMKNQSNQVLSDVNAIDRHWKKIGRLIKGTRHYWEGDASNAHIRIYRDAEDEINNVIARLKENPVKLQMMAGVYEEAEAAAEEISNTLPTELF
jgi:uncharacterized protein YajQ (UPF0234 family)